MIPLISACLYLAGGQIWKPFRWGMGLILGACFFHGWIQYILTVAAYFIATSAFPYGEKSWLNPIGEYAKFFVCGLAFGCASISLVGYFGIVQGIVSGIGFLVLKVLDDKNILKNPWQELLRGFIGTILIWR